MFKFTNKIRTNATFGKKESKDLVIDGNVGRAALAVGVGYMIYGAIKANPLITAGVAVAGAAVWAFNRDDVRLESREVFDKPSETKEGDLVKNKKDHKGAEPAAAAA